MIETVTGPVSEWSSPMLKLCGSKLAVGVLGILKAFGSAVPGVIVARNDHGTKSSRRGPEISIRRMESDCLHPAGIRRSPNKASAQA
jgi:hypothetical protein